ncbi:MAG: peptidylprolyl isomerase [Actinomycetia bacterium]|nr:peptidylprolyl isomerase [Actinomycetes bacterium]
MKRSHRLTPLLVALGLILASCSSAGIAATVNGSDISDEKVLSLSTEPLDGPVIPGPNFRNLLLNAIFTEAMVTGAEQDFGLAGLDSKQSIDAFVQSATPQETDVLRSISENSELSESAVELVAVQLLTRRSVQEELAQDPEIITSVWEEDRDLLVQACARHIVLATEAEAEVVQGRIESGEGFSDLVAEVSLDTQSPGGAFPCPLNPSSLGDPFRTVLSTAPVGEVTAPVQSRLGWHVILVDSRETPATFEAFAEDPALWMPASVLDAEWTTWLNDTLAESSIDVRSQIGEWVSTSDGILPPPASP